MSPAGQRHVVRAGAAAADDARLSADEGAVSDQGELCRELGVSAVEALQSGAIVAAPGVGLESLTGAGLLQACVRDLFVERRPAVAGDFLVVDAERAEVIGALAAARDRRLARFAARAGVVGPCVCAP